MALTNAYYLSTDHMSISLSACELCEGEDNIPFIFIYSALSIISGILLVNNLVELNCLIILQKNKLRLKMNKDLSTLE